MSPLHPVRHVFIHPVKIILCSCQIASNPKTENENNQRSAWVDSWVPDSVWGEKNSDVLKYLPAYFSWVQVSYGIPIQSCQNIPSWQWAILVICALTHPGRIGRDLHAIFGHRIVYALKCVFCVLRILYVICFLDMLDAHATHAWRTMPPAVLAIFESLFPCQLSHEFSVLVSRIKSGLSSQSELCPSLGFSVFCDMWRRTIKLYGCENETVLSLSRSVASARFWTFKIVKRNE